MRIGYDFADLEAHYQDRPSLWIEPEGDWGAGAVRLVEIPSDQEIYDNIVAYWRPRDPLVAGQAHRFAYRMLWSDETGEAPPPRRSNVARVLDTHMGLNFERDGWLVAIDFDAHPVLDALPEEGGGVVGATAFIAAKAATTEGVLQRNPETGGTRLAFQFDPADAEAVELRAQVVVDGAPVTEVWIYRWTAT